MCTETPDNTKPEEDRFVLSTPVAGVTPGTGISTAPPLTLWNPGDSLYFLDVESAIAAYVSGTLGAGALVLALSQQSSSISGGTPLLPTNRYPAGAQAPKVVGNTGGTLERTPIIYRPVAQAGAFAAATAWPVQETPEMPCRVTLPPGWAASLHYVGAAGAAPLMLLALAFKLRLIKQ